MGEERPVSPGLGEWIFLSKVTAGSSVLGGSRGGAVFPPVDALMAAQRLGSLVGSWGQLWTPELDHSLAGSSPLTQRQGQRKVAVRVAWTLAGRPVTRGAGQREGGRPGGPGLLPEETRSIAPAAECLLPDPPRLGLDCCPCRAQSAAWPCGASGGEGQLSEGETGRACEDAAGRGGLRALDPPASPPLGFHPSTPARQVSSNSSRGMGLRGAGTSPPQSAPCPEARDSSPGDKQSRAPNLPGTPKPGLKDRGPGRPARVWEGKPGRGTCKGRP